MAFNHELINIADPRTVAQAKAGMTSLPKSLIISAISPASPRPDGPPASAGSPAPKAAWRWVHPVSRQVPLDLRHDLLGGAPQQAVGGDLLRPHRLTGVDALEQRSLGGILDRLPPVGQEPVHVPGQDLVADLVPVGADPGVPAQDPRRRTGRARRTPPRRRPGTATAASDWTGPAIQASPRRAARRTARSATPATHSGGWGTLDGTGMDGHLGEPVEASVERNRPAAPHQAVGPRAPRPCGRRAR